MNDKKYDGVYYKFRKIEDLKEMICTSAEMFADDNAYLQKDKDQDHHHQVKDLD